MGQKRDHEGRGLGGDDGHRPVNMALKNAAGLKSFVAEVSNPKGREYGQLFEHREVRARYAPAAADVAAVQKHLEQAGMKNVTVGPHGVYVSATATVAQLRTAFKVTQNLYSYKGMTLRANKEEPTIPAALAGKIVYIGGLDDTDDAAQTLPSICQSRRSGRAEDRGVAAAASPSAAAVTPPPVAASNESPYCNHYFGAGALVAKLSTPADVYGAAIPWLGLRLHAGANPLRLRPEQGEIHRYGRDGSDRDAYASPTSERHQPLFGQSQAAEDQGRRATSRRSFREGIYTSRRRRPAAPTAGGRSNRSTWPPCTAARPGAKIVYVGARDCGTSLDIAFINTVYNHVADVVTDSWGNNGESIAPGIEASYDQAVMAGAAQGITVLFSSGDDGDSGRATASRSGSWPATSAYVTGVGGTSLLSPTRAGEVRVRLGHLSCVP